jgi:hypothetical protein
MKTKFPIRLPLPPVDGQGKKSLPIELHRDHITVRLDTKNAEPNPAVYVDWFNGKLTLICYDGVNDDPIAKVRLNADGTVKELGVASHLRGKVTYHL